MPTRKGQRCKHGNKATGEKRCYQKACFFVHEDEEPTECRHKGNCQRTDCVFIHPAPVCKYNPSCKNPNCIYKHLQSPPQPQPVPPKTEDRTISVEPDVARFLWSHGMRHLRTKIADELDVSVSKNKNCVVIGPSSDRAVDIDQARRDCERFIKEQICKEIVTVQGCTTDDLLAAQHISNVARSAEVGFFVTGFRVDLQQFDMVFLGTHHRKAPQVDQVAEQLSSELGIKAGVVQLPKDTTRLNQPVYRFKVPPSFLKGQLEELFRKDTVKLEGLGLFRFERVLKFSGGAQQQGPPYAKVFLTYLLGNTGAPSTIKNLRERLHEQERTKELVELPKQDKAVAKALNTSFGHVKRHLLEEHPNLRIAKGVQLSKQSQFPVVELEGPVKDVRHATDWLKQYLSRIFVEKLSADRPTQAMYLCVMQFARQAVQELNTLNRGHGGDGSDDDDGDEDGSDLASTFGDADDDSLASLGSGKERRATNGHVVRYSIHTNLNNAKGAKKNDPKNTYLSVHLTGPSELKEEIKSLAARIDTVFRTFKEDIIKDVPEQAFNNHKDSLSTFDCTIERKNKTVHLAGAAEAVAGAAKLFKRAQDDTKHVSRTIAASNVLYAMALRLAPNKAEVERLCEGLASSHPRVTTSTKVNVRQNAASLVLLSGPKTHVQAALEAAKAKISELESTLAVGPVSLKRVEEAQLNGKTHRQKACKEGVDVRRARAASELLLSTMSSANDENGVAGGDGASVSGDAAESSSGCQSGTSGHGVQAGGMDVLLKAQVTKGPQICVLEGKVAQLQGVDAVVNPANSMLQHGGGLARSISKAAGPRFQHECFKSVSEKGMIPVGQARKTGSGDLQHSMGVQAVIHAVGTQYRQSQPGQDHQLRQCVQQSLQLATQDPYIRCIAIPAIGTGRFGWPSDMAAEIIVRAVLQEAAKGTLNKLDTVYLFDADPAKARALKNAAEKASSTGLQVHPGQVPPQPPQPVPDVPKFVWVWDKEGYFENRWKLYDYDQMVQLEDAYARGVTGDVRIAGDHFGNPSDSKHIPAGERHPVYTVNMRTMMQRNVASGYERQVKRVPYKDGDKLPPLFEERRRESQRQWQQWQQYHGQPRQHQQGVSIQILSKGSHKLSQAGTSSTAGAKSAPTPAAGNACNEDLQAQVPDHGFVLCGPRRRVEEWQTRFKDKARALWFEKTYSMLGDRQANLRLIELPEVKALLHDKDVAASVDNDGTIRLQIAADSHVNAVIRVMNDNLERARVPDTWVGPDGGPYQGKGDSADDNNLLVEVDRDTDEFNTVLSIFNRDGFDKEVVKVQRVQNQALWDAYFDNRKHIQGHDKTDANEKRLFHGTSTIHPLLVVETGFDFRCASSGMFGRGTYFAEDMSYSNRYRYVVGDGTAQVFIGQVAAGNVEDRESDRNIIRPSKGYHSVRGKVAADHQAIIIYDLRRAYPEYLVTYKIH